MADRGERQRREAAGRTAEALCILLLRLKGFRILARRWRSPLGEIDIVARRRRLVVFVEVKARAEAMSAGESLGARQRRRISRAAAGFLQKHPQFQEFDLRFDAMLVVPGRIPQHIQDAWRAET